VGANSAENGPILGECDNARRTEPAIVGVGVDCLVESELAAVDSDNTHVDSNASRHRSEVAINVAIVAYSVPASPASQSLRRSSTKQGRRSCGGDLMADSVNIGLRGLLIYRRRYQVLFAL